MMEGYAAEAVRLGADFGVALDYSDASVQDLERILAELSEKLEKLLPSASATNDTAQAQLDVTARVWGGYFGETIRRLWGGEWGVETYPGSVAPVISVDIGRAKLFPVMKVYRRLTQGGAENVWDFYQMVREKLAVGNKQ